MKEAAISITEKLLETDEGKQLIKFIKENPATLDSERFLNVAGLVVRNLLYCIEMYNAIDKEIRDGQITLPDL